METRIEKLKGEIDHILREKEIWENKSWLQRVFSSRSMTEDDIERHARRLFDEGLYQELAQINNEEVSEYVFAQLLKVYRDLEDRTALRLLNAFLSLDSLPAIIRSKVVELKGVKEQQIKLGNEFVNLLGG